MTFGRLRAACYSATAVVLGILLLALAAVTFTDVVGRYLFAAPLPGGPELTELLVMAVVFGGLPALCLDDGHVTADLVTQRLGPRALVVQLALARLASAAVLGLACWQLWKIGLRPDHGVPQGALGAGGACRRGGLRPLGAADPGHGRHAGRAREIARLSKSGIPEETWAGRSVWW